MSLNSNLINSDASHYSGNVFSSNVNPNSVNVNAMPLPGNNVQSAASYFPCPNGSCSNQSGGKRSKINRRKINKISRMYKMKSKRHIKRMKSRLRSKSRHSRRYTRNNRNIKRRRQRGGNSQYQNNMPMTQTYSLGGQLSSANSALASPPPYQVLSNNTSCVDNYNHFTNSGFPSRGWH